MDLEKRLRQLHSIQSDPNRRAVSRRAILAHTPHPPKARFTLLQFISQNVQSAGAIALTGALLVLIFGGFSIFSLSPFKLSSLDPVGLRAEAQDIDMQIQVASVQYQQVESGAPASASSAQVAPKSKTETATPESADASLGGTASPATSTATSSPLTVDEALEALME